METTTIYHINETDCTISLAQSVMNDDESLHSAILNAKTYTFDELMNQHRIFTQNSNILDTFRDRIHSCLRVARSVNVNTEDMLARFTAEHGENVFFQGFVTAVTELYDTERQPVLKPDDVVKAKLNRKKICAEISERINAYFDNTLNRLFSQAYFDYRCNMELFCTESMRTIIAADDFTFHVFHESDNALTMLLAELGHLTHRNKWVICECGFCKKNFLDKEDAVCCHSTECREMHEKQKKKIADEYTKEYSKVKANYDSYVRQLLKNLRTAEIDKRYPADYDEFKQAQEERKADMDRLKKYLIRNGLPVDELLERGNQYRVEMKALADEVLEKWNMVR